MDNAQRIFSHSIAEELSVDQLKKLGGGGYLSPEQTGNCFTTNVTTSRDGGPQVPDEPDYICGGPDR
jgi:hypothetical protein